MRGATTGFAIALLNHIAHSKSDQEEVDTTNQEDPIEDTEPKPFLTNDSDHDIYFKPEGNMMVDGVEYKNGESYVLHPGETFNGPIDGIAVPHLVDSKHVYKIIDGGRIKVTNSQLKTFEIGTGFVNSFRGSWVGEDWLHNQQNGYWGNFWRKDHSWDSLFNRQN